MGKQIFVLKFKDKDNTFSFEDKVYLVEDKKIIANLSKPNIKNQESELLIESMGGLHISDVVQIKINVAETGHFLASFNKEIFDEEKRKLILEEIGKLKNDETPTIDTQTKKIQELLDILNNFEPIYVTFSNNGDLKIDLQSLSNIQLKFPLLVLAQLEKKRMISFGVKKDRENKNKEFKEKGAEYKPFPLLDIDYFFVFLFSLLGSFAIVASVFEMMNKEGVAAFLIILSLVFTIVLVIATHSTIYKKGVVRNPLLRYYLSIFVVIGIAAGIVSGFFICKGILKTEIQNFDYKKMILISIPITIVALLSSLSTCRLFNIFIKQRLNKKPQ